MSVIPGRLIEIDTQSKKSNMFKPLASRVRNLFIRFFFFFYFFVILVENRNALHDIITIIKPIEEIYETR